MYLGRWATASLIAAYVACAGAQDAPPKAQSPADVLRSLQQNSGDIEQLRSALQSPNPSVRASAFTAMIQSNNPSLITMAINEGHISSDAALRDLAARAAFRELRGFQIEPDGDSPPDTQSTIVAFSNENGLRVKLTGYDWVSGAFMNYAGVGQISGSRLTVKTFFCQGTLAAKEGSWTYEGLVVCANGTTKLSNRMHVSIR